MSWWQERKARKALEKLGMDKNYLKQIGKEIKWGTKELEQQRDDLRKLESPTYHKLIKEINLIIDRDAPIEQKKSVSIKLINNAVLSNYERNDLLKQIESIYGKSNNMKTINADNFEFNDSNSFLLFGQTGSGKSFLVHKLINELEKKYKPNELKYAIFDHKQAEFMVGNNCKQEYLLFGIVKDIDLTLDRLEYLGRIAEKRLRYSETKPLIFIYIEECDAACLDQKRFDDAVIKISKHAKETNMILIYSSSRVAPNTISDNILANFDVVLMGYYSSDNIPERFDSIDIPTKRYDFTVKNLR